MRAELWYIHHHQLAFEPDFFLKQRSILNRGQLYRQMPLMLLWSFELQTFCSKVRNGYYNTTEAVDESTVRQIISNAALVSFHPPHEYFKHE